MKLALYRLSISLLSGSEKTIFELVRRSRHNWTIFTSYYDIQNSPPLPKGVDLIDLKDSWAANHNNIVGNAGINLPRKQLPLKDFDGLLIVSVGLEQLLFLANNIAPAACLCFTPLRLIYDNALKTSDENKNFVKSVKRSLLAPVFKRLDKAAWSRAQKIFPISNEIKKRLTRLGVANSKMQVIYPGIDSNEYKPSYTYQKYFLLPGRIMWTKNIELGVNSFSQLIRSGAIGQDFKLIIAGMLDEDSKSYFEKIKKLCQPMGKRVEFVISPSDEELNDLYINAYAVLFTALNEDYGIVPLEAMAYAKPVISVNEGGPLETIKDAETGFLVNSDPDSFARAMKRLANDIGLVEQLGKNAVEHVKKFDWQFFVNTIDDYFEEINQ